MRHLEIPVHRTAPSADGEKTIVTTTDVGKVIDGDRRETALFLAETAMFLDEGASLPGDMRKLLAERLKRVSDVLCVSGRINQAAVSAAMCGPLKRGGAGNRPRPSVTAAEIAEDMKRFVGRSAAISYASQATGVPAETVERYMAPTRPKRTTSKPRRRP